MSALAKVIVPRGKAGQELLRQAFSRVRNKYNARRAVYNGHLYHSAREADYARELDLRKRAGEIRAWRRQVRLPLKVNGNLICAHIVDFLVTYPDGSESYHEVKGYETEVYRLKRKLVAALYPNIEYQVIK